MSKFNKILLGCALVLGSSVANSQVSVQISDSAGIAIIPAEHIESISIDPVTSVVSITTNVNYSIQPAEVEPRVCTANCDGAPEFAAYTVVTPVTVGESTTVKWVTTSNATSCTPSGDYAGWTDLQNIGTGNPGLAVPMNLVGTFTLSLTCHNGDLPSITVTRKIVVEDVVNPDPDPDPVEPSVCDDFVSPLSGFTYLWDDFFAENFPNPGYANEYATINRAGYLAIEFDTGNTFDTGKLMTLESTTTSGSRLGSVSQCPGDFDVAPECTFTWGTAGGIIWSTDGYAGACQLDPQSTYYFNITFTDGFNPRESTCGDSRCITKVRVYNP